MFHPSSSSAPNCSDLSMHHAETFSALPTAPTEIPRSSFFHETGGLLALPNVAASAPPPYYIHRTTISQFFPLHLQLPDPATLSPPSSSSAGDFLEFSNGAMRRVLSTGDLHQVMNVSPPPAAASDTYIQDARGHLPQKVGRYNAEERKEKINRYRVKRRQRNFHKKITYACRKTLADSRPRVQGRFARNGETDAEGEAIAAGFEREASGNSYEHCNHSNFTKDSSNSNDSLCRDSGKSVTFDAGNWWWETPIEAGAANGRHGHHHHHYQQQQQQLLGFDVLGNEEDELWASLADMFSGT